MKWFLKLVFILSVLSILNPQVSHAVLVDKIKAVVNDEVITQSEIDRLLYPIYMRYKEIYEPAQLEEKMKEASEEILNQLIDDKILLSEAKKRGVEVGEAEVAERIENFKSRIPPEENFDGLLRKQNISIKDVEKQYKDQIMIEWLLDSEIRRRIQILPQEAETYYSEHIDEFKEEEQVRVSGILIRLKSERTEEQSLRLVVNILQRLKSGEDFYILAKNYSEGTNAEQGGDMGFVRKGQMIDIIDKNIFKLKIDEFTDLVETPLGFYIFKVYDRKEESLISLFDARPQIMDAIYRKKAADKFAEWMAELKKNAFISIK